MNPPDIDIRTSDALDLLRSIPDGTVDLIVTDPPYLFNNKGGAGAFGVKNQISHRIMGPGRGHHIGGIGGNV